MDWMGIAAVVFFGVTVNHLGLIEAVEKVIKHRLPIINCPRCLTFWGTLAYGLSGDGMTAHPSVLSRLLAISILCSYLAMWLELIEGFIDTLYDKLYEQIYPTADTADTDAPGAGSDVSDVPGESGR